MKHLSQEEMFDLLIEAGPEPRHLGECPACRRRFEELAAFVRAAAETGPEPDWEAQRRAIMAGVARNPRTTRGLRLATALAAGLLLALGLTYYLALGPGRAPQEVPAQIAQAPETAEPLALLEPAEEEFDRFVEFMIPLDEEDGNETDSIGGLHSGGAPASRPGLC